MPPPHSTLFDLAEGGRLVSHLQGPAKCWVASTSPLHHVSDQSLLAIVGGQNGDLVSLVATQAHVLVHADYILSLAQILRAPYCLSSRNLATVHYISPSGSSLACK